MLGRILILVENQFRDEEAIYPYYRFIEAGYDVKTVGPEAGVEYTGKFGLPVKSDLSPAQVDLDEVIAVVIPGGNAPDKMRVNKDMVNLVREANNRCRVIAAICHGGWMLVEADIIRGKKVTGYIAISTDLKNAGATYMDQEVVTDGNIVTSRKPEDLPAFCRSTLELIGAYYK
ncbi:MAG: type 1 glutamine amidotransferase [Actinobacteria bacterium]|nr:type 1 glutamine amidotransferase [Actinomycetota bacterium]